MRAHNKNQNAIIVSVKIDEGGVEFAREGGMVRRRVKREMQRRVKRENKALKKW